MGSQRVGHDRAHMHSFFCVLSQSCPTLCNPMDCHPPGFSVSGIDSPGKNTGVGSRSLPGDLPNPGMELGSPALQADSLPAE